MKPEPQEPGPTRITVQVPDPEPDLDSDSYNSASDIGKRQDFAQNFCIWKNCAKYLCLDTEPGESLVMTTKQARNP